MTPEDFQSKFGQAWTLRNEGQYDQVLAIAEENLTLAQEAEDKASEALFVKLFGQVYHDRNELKEALSYYKQLERIYIDLQDEPKQMHALRHIGQLYLDLQEHECAEKCLIQVVNTYEEASPNALELANTHRLYALALGSINRNIEAKTYWTKAKNTYEQLWIPEAVEECEGYLATLG